MIPNQWYAVLESHEVKDTRPVSFKRLNEDLVFWRDARGKVVVMTDRCPHRQVKLSLGKVVEGNIECPFHGFQFDGQGACQLIPANGKNGPRPKVFQVRTYPVREEYGFIWAWYGEPRQEYPPIAFFEGLEDFSYSTLQRLWKVHYTRAAESLLDVAHLPFVHPNTIGRGGQTLVNGPYLELEDDSLYVWMNNQQDVGQPAFKPTALTKPDGPWLLGFKFPNLWMLQPGANLKMMAALAPVDEENTILYLRYYHNMTKSPLARRVIAKVGAVSNWFITREDERVVFSQPRIPGGFAVGDQYIPADRPIVVYYQHRDKLRQAASQPEREVAATPPHSEQRRAG